MYSNAKLLIRAGYYNYSSTSEVTNLRHGVELWRSIKLDDRVYILHEYSRQFPLSDTKKVFTKHCKDFYTGVEHMITSIMSTENIQKVINKYK